MVIIIMMEMAYRPMGYETTTWLALAASSSPSFFFFSFLFIM